MTAILTVFIAGIITTGIVFLAFRALSKQASASVGKERELIRAEIDKYDEARDRAIAALKEMVSLDEMAKIEADRVNLKQTVEVESGKVKKLEKDLEALQVRVDKQEAIHNELKRGKEDSDKLAAALRENKDRINEEAGALAVGLNQTITTVDKTLKGGQYGGYQNELNNLESALQTTAASLTEYAEIYTRGATRFVNLEKQYEELEREFRKLVDKALTGEEVEESAT